MTTTYPPPAAVDALTADGAIITIRPVHGSEADRAAVAGLFEQASGASLRLRFFTNPAGPLLAAEITRLLRPPTAEHATLAAELAGETVGVASYERRGPQDHRAEFAVFVADRHQGRGIGTLLLEHLAQYARRHGITELFGEVLAGNARMLRVAGDLTAATTPYLADGVVEVTLTTAADEAALAAVAARDRAAGQASLRPLLAPHSVAIVGAGRTGGVGHELLTGLVSYGFTGPVYPVNPHATAVAGVPAYPSLRHLPGPIELAVIAVPAPQVVTAVTDAAAAGARAAVVLSAGFADAGEAGTRRQDELVRAARAHNIRLVGPNCLGVINTDPLVRLDASFAPATPPAGGLAVASQSGAVGIAVLDQLRRAGCGTASFVSLGNKADVSGNDLISYWYDDPATRAVALYLESFGNPRKFARLARALARRKPVLAVVSGHSGAGARAGASHTGAAAAPEAAVTSLFAQAGVVQVEHLGELVDAARMLTDQPLPQGHRLGIVGNAGGANVLAADAAESAGLRLPEQVSGLPNPLDLGADATPAGLAESLSIVAGSGAVDAVLVLLAATRANDPPALWRQVASVADRWPALPLAGVALGGGAPVALGERRAPVFELPEQATRALGRAVAYAAWRREPLGTRPPLPEVDTEAARALVAEGLAEGGGWQPYARIAGIAAAYQLPLSPSRVVHSAAAAVAAAAEIGYPVALKAADPQLVHKSDIGAVRLDLADGSAVTTAYHAVAAALARPDPPVLVQPMASGSVELVAGVSHEPHFGSLVMVGLGGVHTDLLADRTFRLVPLTDLDAGRMWRSLRSAPLLTGYRNLPPVATDELELLLLRLGRLAEELPEVAELDLNPVLAGPGQVVAVDAALRLCPVGEEPDPTLRRLR
ncbi:GNAT family N-acetyltransferase [Natronosporangium hydrolyticum]|uniref:GNAT family N-acetyltransferase n=1 Tax=Natronosporangium hydrolyticum TaxID=2811111 RepID=A0A895YS03_9ACTN|nr:bifunctional GNAT family N-acetyltransferase/acetate--CoA ligase family protein [Natronosporangium hydrolyticum]QSB16890.1 GNAT family N-acetyltransferase [Natronosporangium hydrolyticum]